MGNREQLIDGALKCLMERGWAHTTVRDIAAAAGVNHAAIGYHFGSKDALLAVAVAEATDAWSREVFSATPQDPVRDWEPVMRWLADNRPALLTNLDLLTQAQRSPEMRGHVAEVHERIRRETAAWAAGVPAEEVTEDAVRGIGSVYVALVTGLAVQAIIDPDHTPSAADVASGLRELAAAYGTD